MTSQVSGLALTSGAGSGSALVLSDPLSFWGGVDDEGVIVDVHHPHVGASVVGAVLVMPAGRGSSSSSSSLAELIRAGVGPRAIVLHRPDAIVALGSIVAGELYGIHVPVVVVTADLLTGLATGDQLQVAVEGDLASLGRR